MSKLLRMASAQYPVEWLDDWKAYADKADRWVSEAVASGAQLLVFPEYGAMELTSLFGREVAADLARQLEAMQSLVGDFRDLWKSLALQYRVHLLAPSFPVRDPDGVYRNRAYLFSPSGAVGWQDKLIMTRFECEQWGVGAGDEAKVFETELGNLAVAICYDSEFPLIIRRQVEAGANLLLVPSCTDGLAGYHRVRIGCQARALENQCYVVHSPLVGKADWSSAVDVNVGSAGVYTPADLGFPHDGVLVCGPMNEPQWVHADIDLARMTALRSAGQVLNHRDWPRQNAAWPSITKITL